MQKQLQLTHFKCFIVIRLQQMSVLKWNIMHFEMAYEVHLAKKQASFSLVICRCCFFTIECFSFHFCIWKSTLKYSSTLWILLSNEMSSRQMTEEMQHINILKEYRSFKIRNPALISVEWYSSTWIRKPIYYFNWAVNENKMKKRTTSKRRHSRYFQPLILTAIHTRKQKKKRAHYHDNRKNPSCHGILQTMQLTPIERILLYVIW